MMCFASLAMLLSNPLAPPLPNLLPNPSFEDVADERPVGWQAHDFKTGGLARVEAGGHDGGQCVALESRDATERIAWRAVADLPPATKYVAAGGWYRTTGVAAAAGRGACYRVHFHGLRDGRMQELALRQVFLPPADDWTPTADHGFPVPDGATKVELQVFNWLTPGITRWDDVSVRALTAAEYAALPPSRKPPAPPVPPVTLEAEAAQLDPARAAIVAQDSFESKQGVSLREGQPAHVDDLAAAPDLVFDFAAAEPGRYRLQTHAATDAHGTELMRRATGKQASMYLRLAIDDGRPTQRVVFVPWSRPESCLQTLGKFTFTGEPQRLKVWLPVGVRLDWLRLSPYVPPRVPDAAASYQPTIVPPASHPRVWVNADSLPQVRANLTRAENAAVWERLLERADKPFQITFGPDAEVGYNAGLEAAAQAKAFAYLMTGQESYGREATKLILAYLPLVEFGNLLDITREIGRAIYAASLTYDWCYDLLTPAERDTIREHLMRLADDMEIGWPPFLQMIVNGHGNEAQVNRDLLAMSIAIYDEDPVPYRYCAYRILEELVPMRRFEYQSPRHNQGVSYGPYRYGWDLHAAWLFRRMCGHPVFDDNLGGVYYQWLYMRVPNHRALRDGDGFSDSQPANLGLTTLLNYAYTADPVVKWDFVRAGGLGGDPMMILLLNDPDLQPADGLDGLPLTKDFGPILGSMIARTGWNMGRNTADVVVEMKGGGYHFGNHQHADAGSFQIYWRGLQAVDLGEYRFYGTPYDSNFTKRSVSHSLMLVVDPKETFAGASVNDGGTRNIRTCPTSPEQATTDPLFAFGKVRAASFGPDPSRPCYSHFAVDLTSAYSAKIKAFQRSFTFLNLGDETTPAALLVLDHLMVADPAYRKYWQVNTLNPPDRTAGGAVLHNEDLGLRGRVDLHMLRPAPADRTLDILSGPEANSVFGTPFEPPFDDRPESHGHRLMFSPTGNRDQETFLTVMIMADEDAAALPVQLEETDAVYLVTLADRAVVMSRQAALLDHEVTFTLPAGPTWQWLATGLAPGTWSVTGTGATYNLPVDDHRHTAFALLPAGSYILRPQAEPGAATFTTDLRATVSEPIVDRVFLGGTIVPGAKVSEIDGVRYVPAEAVAAALGLSCQATTTQLRLGDGPRAAVFRDGTAQVALSAGTFPIPAPARRSDGVWRLPAELLACYAHRSLAAEDESNTVEFGTSPLPWPAEVLWVHSLDVPDLPALHGMLCDLPERTEYWAAEGPQTGFEVVMAQPLRVAGVGIRWHLGDQRRAKFAIEVSDEGKSWRRVYEGESSGRGTDLQTYAFPPVEAARVRFVGFGNTANAWNSLRHFRVLPAG